VDCPACRQVMIVAEREAIELDCCPRCRGIWFDAGELDLLAEKLGLPGGEHDPRRFVLAETREKSRRCPRCDRALEKVWFDESRTVLLDRCGGGHGLWFDRGELGRVLEIEASPGSTVTGTLLSFLGESFRR
jgi:uncharacterized protein